jgi:hypothetical protein
MSLQVLGPYEILGALGAGGMGEVFRARDMRLNREVAIKLLPKDFPADPGRIRRLGVKRPVAAMIARLKVSLLHTKGIVHRADDNRESSQRQIQNAAFEFVRPPAMSDQEPIIDSGCDGHRRADFDQPGHRLACFDTVVCAAGKCGDIMAYQDPPVFSDPSQNRWIVQSRQPGILDPHNIKARVLPEPSTQDVIIEVLGGRQRNHLALAGGLFAARQQPAAKTSRIKAPFVLLSNRQRPCGSLTQVVTDWALVPQKVTYNRIDISQRQTWVMLNNFLCGSSLFKGIGHRVQCYTSACHADSPVTITGQRHRLHLFHSQAHGIILRVRHEVSKGEIRSPKAKTIQHHVTNLELPVRLAPGSRTGVPRATWCGALQRNPNSQCNEHH